MSAMPPGPARPSPASRVPTAPPPSDDGYDTLSGRHMPHRIDPATRRKVLQASFIGNFVEWFDYAAYGYLAATIGAAFFPEADRATQLLSSFAIFAISFIVRPIGGFIWGYLGDRFGRRTALGWSILIMSGATFLIALIPSYSLIGILAPIALLILRLVQGFSASGEYAGASAFLVEYAPPHRRGIYAAMVPASTATGLLLGSLIAALLTATLSDQQMVDWGWRLPFLLAAPMGLIGRYIRTRLEEFTASVEAILAGEPMPFVTIGVPELVRRESA